MSHLYWWWRWSARSRTFLSSSPGPGRGAVYSGSPMLLLPSFRSWPGYYRVIGAGV